MSVAFYPIKQESNTETIQRKIQQASAHMFVREFCQNAMEAAQHAEHPRVKWWQYTEGGFRKLYVWNNGKGMDPDKLVRVMNICASGEEKVQSADGNYGQGAKLTGLKANHAGILWRSCKDGMVSQLHLGWNGKIPGIFPQGEEPDTELVTDVSHLYKDITLSEWDKDLFRRVGQDCGMLDFEWTMAVFLGTKLKEQDTVLDPWGDKQPGDGGTAYWLTNQINRRFFDIKKYHVSAICNATAAPQFRRCEGLYHIPVEKEDTVVFDDCRIRYCITKEAKSGSSESAKGYSGHCALVFKGEIYSGIFGKEWSNKGHRFGIFAGQGRVAIQVILSDDYSASPNEQRSALERELPFGSREQITLAEFEDLIEENCPQFIIDFIESQLTRRKRCSEKVTQKIDQLMQDLQFRTVTPKPEGDVPIDKTPSEGTAPAQPASDIYSKPTPPPNPEPRPEPKPIDPDNPPKPRERKASPSVFGVMGKPVATGVRRKINEKPVFEWIDGEDDGTVGYFDDKHNMLYLKRCHPVLAETCKSAMKEYNIASRHADEVREEAENWIGYAGLRHVIYAKSLFRDGKFNDVQFAAATTSQALTASIGYCEMHVGPVEAAFRGKRDK